MLSDRGPRRGPAPVTLPLRPELFESVAEARGPWLTTLYLGVPVLALLAAAFVPAAARRT